MATSSTRSSMFPDRSRRAFRLDMEGRTLVLLISLLASTGVVVFYLGVVTGMAVRDPNGVIPLATQVAVPPEVKTPKPGSLDFNKALESGSQMQGLRARGDAAAQRTDQLISKAPRQLELKETETPAPPNTTTVTSPVVQSPQAQQPSRPIVTAAGTPAAASPSSQPRQPTKPVISGGLYTVQVFSSPNQDNAQDLLSKLKKQGYSAYLNRFQSSDNRVWYRVRVGKTSREAAESLSNKLRNESGLKSPKVIKL